MQNRTIIVGGGIAGMTCALRLLEAGQEFILIADRLGGRIQYSEEAQVNFGAYFIMGNYAEAKKLLIRQALINPLDVCFHDRDKASYAVLSGQTLRRLPEFVRFLLAMREFAAHYEPYKQRCLRQSQKAALEADPYMTRLYTQSAAQFIQEKRYTQAAAEFIGKFSYACTGVGADELNALDFLNVSMGLLVPIHQFKFDQQAMVEKLAGHLVMDTIRQVERLEGGCLLTGITGQQYQAENVVFATPAQVTKELLHLAEIRGASQIYVHHVKAQLKPEYRRYGINLFPPSSEIMLTARQTDGSFLIYSRVKIVDLDEVCERYELLTAIAWETAMYVRGRVFLEQQYGEHIYLAGDHNGLGLEPAAISGIYAANQIIQKSTENKNRGG